MPKVQQKPPNFDERRFAALLAGFDLGNASEEEAVSKGRALRRMAANVNMRVVDLMELPEVKQAIDDQMEPVRAKSAALQEALEHTSALQEELTERTRDVRRLAESLRQRDEAMEAMQRRLAGAQSGSMQASASSVPGVPSWGFQAGAALLVLVLLIVAFFTGNFKERNELNGLGNSEGTSAGVVRENGAVRPLPKHGALHHRVHRGGASVGNR